ncbi:MAG: DUF4249 domain-containing protein [Bacteroidota bacterium]
MWRSVLLCLFAGMFLMGATCERTVELDIDEPPPRLVVNSSFTLGERVEVSVSSSQSILENRLPFSLSDAIVTLYQGDQFIEQLELFVDPAPRILEYYITKSFKPEAAVTYTIRVEAVGFETVEAHSFIPEPVSLTKLEVSDLQEVAGSEVYSRLFTYRVSLDFDDPPEEENFYHLNIYQEISDIDIAANGDTTYFRRRLERLPLQTSNTKIVPDMLIGGLLIKDNPGAEDLTFSVAVEIVPEFEALGQIFAELRTVSREYYLYFTTVNRQQNQSDGPFNDPIIIFNNVENGSGYFAGYNTTQDSIQLSF